MRLRHKCGQLVRQAAEVQGQVLVALVAIVVAVVVVAVAVPVDVFLVSSANMMCNICLPRPRRRRRFRLVGLGPVRVATRRTSARARGGAGGGGGGRLVGGGQAEAEAQQLFNARLLYGGCIMSRARRSMGRASWTTTPAADVRVYSAHAGGDFISDLVDFICGKLTLLRVGGVVVAAAVFAGVVRDRFGGRGGGGIF